MLSNPVPARPGRVDQATRAPVGRAEGSGSPDRFGSPIGRASSIEELRDIARRRVPRAVFDYVDGGAEAEISLRRNREAFERVELTPRFLTDVSTST